FFRRSSSCVNAAGRNGRLSLTLTMTVSVKANCNGRAPMRTWLLAICLIGWMQASDGGPALALAAPSIQPLGVPVGFIDFTPTDVNSDGSVIVGTSQTPAVSFSFAVRGFLWTAGGFQDLGSLGGDSVRPMRISGQGDVVVGVANLAPGSVAFRIFR